MNAPAESLTVRTSYNLGALRYHSAQLTTSFSAGQLAAAVAKRVPNFQCTFKPDRRQAIADSWPQSVDDAQVYCR